MSTHTSPSKKRLMRDFRRLQNDPPHGIKAAPLQNDIMNWEAMIFGPSDSPWKDGTFKLTLSFTREYPNKAPKVKFVTKMFHPNIYNDGAICLDILQHNWSPIYDICAILTSIQSLLTDPNPNSPANVEAAKLYQENRQEYERRVSQVVEQSFEQDSDDSDDSDDDDDDDDADDSDDDDDDMDNDDNNNNNNNDNDLDLTSEKDKIEMNEKSNEKTNEKNEETKESNETETENEKDVAKDEDINDSEMKDAENCKDANNNNNNNNNSSSSSSSSSSSGNDADAGNAADAGDAGDASSAGKSKGEEHVDAGDAPGASREKSNEKK